MPKISQRASTTLSLILSAVGFLLILAGLVFTPRIAALIEELHGEPGKGSTALRVLLYTILALAAVTDAMLVRLLLRVRSGAVFTAESVALIRCISWCCILLGVLFAVLAIWYPLALLVGTSAAFIGLIVRVVKNVVEEATEIKSENDLTV